MTADTPTDACSFPVQLTQRNLRKRIIRVLGDFSAGLANPFNLTLAPARAIVCLTLSLTFVVSSRTTWLTVPFLNLRNPGYFRAQLLSSTFNQTRIFFQVTPSKTPLR